MPDYSWIDRSEKRYRYMLLDRMRMDCDYYIRNNFNTPRTLWADTEQEHIDIMRHIWGTFSDRDKPEWLTLEQIDQFENRMIKN